MSETNETCPRCAICNRQLLLFTEVEDGICVICICTDKTADQGTIVSLQQSLRERDEQLAAVTKEVERLREGIEKQAELLHDIIPSATKFLRALLAQPGEEAGNGPGK